jgi:hypothetical protein
MTQYARQRRMTDTCTVWVTGAPDPNNPYSDGTVTVETYSCNWAQGGKMRRDREGVEFVPRSSFRLVGSQAIPFGSHIVRGTFTDAEPVAGAEIVRDIQTKTPLRGDAIVSVYTG